MTSRVKRQAGFTLIEVLVALLVMMIGLLGVASMQFLALKQVNNSNLRSQINLHVQEMIELVRTNDNSALPAADVTSWKARLARDVPGATATVTHNASTMVVTINWKERELGDDEAEQTYSVTARLEQ